MIAQKSWEEESYQKKRTLTINIEKGSVVNKFVKRRLMVFGVVAGIIGCFMISSMVQQSIMLHKKQQEKKTLEKSLVKLHGQQKKLNTEIINLNDPEYIGKLARKEYFLSKKGEIIFQIGTDKPKSH